MVDVKLGFWQLLVVLVVWVASIWGGMHFLSPVQQVNMAGRVQQALDRHNTVDHARLVEALNQALAKQKK